MYTLNDFFCGAGGLGIGFKDAGFSIEKAWDFDKFAVQTYKENVGDHVEQIAIEDMTIDDVPEAAVWTFGFPCQDLSVAGNQSGMETECNACSTKWKLDTDNQNCPNCQSDDFKAANRSGLFFEIMRLLDEATEREREREREPEASTSGDGGKRKSVKKIPTSIRNGIRKAGLQSLLHALQL